MKCLFGLAFFALAVFGQVALEPCAVCSVIVEHLASQVTKEADKWAEKLPSVSSSVCSPFASDSLSYEKCTSFVSLFAPYAVDLLLSEIKPEEVCGTLGVCEKPNSLNYELLLPQIEDNKITYSLEKKFDETAQFRYRVFLGRFSFLDNSTYSLDVRVNSIADADISIKMTNNKDYVETRRCGVTEECHIEISKPGMGLWYFITVNAKSNGEKSSFSLQLKEENIVNNPWIYQGGSHSGIFGVQMVVVLLAIGMICMVITRCIFRRRLGNLKQKANIEEAIFLTRQDQMEYPMQLVFISQDGSQMPYVVPQYVPMAPPESSVQ